MTELTEPPLWFALPSIYLFLIHLPYKFWILPGLERDRALKLAGTNREGVTLQSTHTHF